MYGGSSSLVGGTGIWALSEIPAGRSWVYRVSGRYDSAAYPGHHPVLFGSIPPGTQRPGGNPTSASVMRLCTASGCDTE
jgi:hypothetical protein